MDDPVEVFERHRRRLLGLAYRMLGTVAEAQDTVQEAYLRWHQTDRSEVRDPGAWLTTVCSRLALNRLNSARTERERYVGPWLPEPFAAATSDASARLELDETISIALLAALERLTPNERAAHLLHDIFDYSFDEVAQVLGTSVANARQLASRARRRLREARPRFRSTAEEQARLLDGFLRACREGDLETLVSLLAPNADLIADGGGKATTAPAPLQGARSIARFFVEVWRHQRRDPATVVRRCWFNGAPGALVSEGGVVIAALGVEADAHRIARIYAVRNPEKLAHVQTSAN